MRRAGGLFLVLMVLSCTPAHLHAQRAGALVTARHGMVVSASEEASRAGVRVLRSGGNAVDAAVASAFALAVTYPAAGNLGGGCYIVIRMADGREAAIDARETAPGAASRDMYLDAQGRVDPDRSLFGPYSSGVPGSVHGLLAALDTFGTKSRASVLAPAIALARNGFRVPPHLAAQLENQRAYFGKYPSSLRVFTRSGRALRARELWRQPDLARTLERISAHGNAGFYDGRTAECIVDAMRSDGGIITRRDLAEYASIVRPVIRGTYRGLEILSMPPSSSGGIALLEACAMLERWPLAEFGFSTVRTAHLMIETERRIFADRAAYAGDPAFVRVPATELVSHAFADARARTISPDRATPSDSIREGAVQVHEGTNTTHLSVIDADGNAVSMTTTINSSFGSKYVVDGAGFLLNNEMDDFSVHPGTPNQFGLTGGEANSIAPGKRMLSSMTPVIVVRDGAPLYIFGSPGGSTIITTVLQVLVNLADHHMPLDRAVSAPRFHHQWKPDSVFAEEGAFTREVHSELTRMGHAIKSASALGRIEAIVVDKNRGLYHGCSDPRAHGAAAGW